MFDWLGLAAEDFREVRAAPVELLESEALPVEQARKMWSAHRTTARSLGWSCFLTLGSFEDIEPTLEAIQSDVASAEEASAESWFEDRRAETLEDEEDEDEVDEGYQGGLADRERALAAFTEDDLSDVRKRASGEPGFDRNVEQGERRFALLRGGPEQVPLVYRFGGWNDCPDPAEQATVLASWRERFGVELGYLGRDVVELLPSEPLGLAEVKEAAGELPLYCSESESARQDFANAASPVWYFWWD